MGTTVVAALIGADRLWCASVGDSRGYLLRDGRLEQLTTDDSWISTLPVQDPSFDPPAKHPMRHVLTNVVGAREQVDFTVTERPLISGDLLLLCSDGLHGELDDKTIASIMTMDGEPAAIADRLVQATLAGRAADNVTAVVVRYDRG
jgi:serine/threonine protein phosphatase PrpC